MICPHCCLTCPHRVKCPKPAWYPEIKPGVKPKPKISPKRREAEKVFMELLSMLGEEEEK